MTYGSNHWKTISEMVTSIALPILPHIRSRKLRSEIISNLFESQAAKYFNSISIPVQAAESDRDPDLVFLQTQTPCEIKVTGSDHPIATKLKWMGGKYSKRTSDYVFIGWHYQPTNRTLYGEEKETIQYFIATKFVDESEWKIIDNGKENYYATVYTTEELLQDSYEIIVGDYQQKTIMFQNVSNIH